LFNGAWAFLDLQGSKRKRATDRRKKGSERSCQEGEKKGREESGFHHANVQTSKVLGPKGEKQEGLSTREGESNKPIGSGKSRGHEEENIKKKP